ncbi:hypothetical protein [Vallitalea okinawensis]|nr:hypothetical protein [Vallitalea okinawensis]
MAVHEFDNQMLSDDSYLEGHIRYLVRKSGLMYSVHTYLVL